VAAAKMNAFIHDMSADIRQGNTMRNPAFLDANGSLQQFDKLAANPMWNQNIATEIYENDQYGRFYFPCAGYKTFAFRRIASAGN
jgi:type I restriction enzyme M protein